MGHPELCVARRQAMFSCTALGVSSGCCCRLAGSLLGQGQRSMLGRSGKRSDRSPSPGQEAATWSKTRVQLKVHRSTLFPRDCLTSAEITGCMCRMRFRNFPWLPQFIDVTALIRVQFENWPKRSPPVPIKMTSSPRIQDQRDDKLTDNICMR